MAKVSINRLFIMVGLYSVFANLAHPITPTLIINLGLPDYMFGIAFAAMALSSFLFSPFWGKMIEQFGVVKVCIVSFIGYAIGQAIFGMATTEASIIIGRLFSGIFTGSIMVSQLMYIIKYSPSDKVGTNLTISATIMAVLSPIGFLVGGYVGDYSISLTFLIQVIGLAVLSPIHWLFLKDDDSYNHKVNLSEVIKGSNPFKILIDSRFVVNKTIFYFLVVVFFSGLGVIAHEQVFNYFLNDQFLVDPSYNGMVKAAVAIIALVVNSTICILIIKKTNINISMIIFYLVMASALIILLGMDTLLWFTIQNLIIFGLVALYTPLLQAVLSSIKTDSSGVLVGVYNSIKSFGNVFGSSLAGIVYGYNAIYPFMLAIFGFLMAALFSFLFYKSRKQQNI